MEEVVPISTTSVARVTINCKYTQNFIYFCFVFGVNFTIFVSATDFPYPRSGHRLVEYNESLYSVGGFNPELWNESNNSQETYYPLFKEVGRK